MTKFKYSPIGQVNGSLTLRFLASGGRFNTPWKANSELPDLGHIVMAESLPDKKTDRPIVSQTDHGLRL